MLSASGTVDRFHDQVVDSRAEFPDRLVVAPGMNPVGKNRDGDLARGLDPDRGAGEAQMTDRLGGEMTPGTGTLGRRRVPSKRPCGTGNGEIAGPELARNLLRN